jgi:hypothetical protein
MGQSFSFAAAMKVSSRRRLVFALLPAVAAAHVPGAAQDYPHPAEQPASAACTVSEGATAEDGIRPIRAHCWGYGLDLGSASRATWSSNEELRATIVELERSGERQVLLLRPFAGGSPIVEDLTGTLALRAARRSWEGLQGLSFELAGFAESGSIAVTSADAAIEPFTLDVAEYIALDEARLAAAQSETEAGEIQ